MYVTFRTIIAPEFSSKTDDELLAMFTFAESAYTLAVLGSRASEAVMLASAHRFSLLARQSAGGPDTGMGPVRSRGAGGLSISYGGGGKVASNWLEEDLSQTMYGLQLLALLGTRSAPRIGIC